MTAFFKRAKDTLCGLVIDIGSGSVAASIVFSDNKKKRPELLYTYRACIPTTYTATPDERIRSMRQALFSVMRVVERLGIQTLYTRGKRLHIEQIFVSCGAPWSQTATQMIHFEQDTPFTVTPRLIDELIRHAHEKEQETYTDAQANALADKGQHIVAKTIIAVSLNGYSVRDPFNTEASEITVAHLRGLAPMHIFTALEDIEKRMCGDITAHIHTSAYILYCVLRDLYPHVKNALIVDVSGETTEIALIQNSIWYESITVAHGINSLVRDMAAVSNTIPEAAQSYFHAYTQGTLTEMQEKLLMRAQKQYAHLFETACVKLAARYVLPRTIFLILDQRGEQFFVDTLKGALSTLCWDVQNMIIPLTSNNTRNLAVVHVGFVGDPRLVIAACFFHMIHADDHIDN